VADLPLKFMKTQNENKNPAAVALGALGGRAGRGASKARTTEQARAAAQKRWRVHIFEEADGWHWSPKSLDFLDARGHGYPSKAAARRAAKAHYEQAGD
jgi:hypothetical protein